MTFSERAVEAAEEAIDEAVRTWQPGTGRRIRRVAAEAALTSALAVDGLALQGWLTIDSAPKDGQIILLVGDRAVSGRWCNNEPGYAGAGWLTIESRECFYAAHVPLGWMPQPLPLTAASDGEVG